MVMMIMAVMVKWPRVVVMMVLMLMMLVLVMERGKLIMRVMQMMMMMMMEIMVSENGIFENWSVDGEGGDDADDGDE